MISKAHERLQKRSTSNFKSPTSTTPDGGRSTSPESPFKLPLPAEAAVLTGQPTSPSRIGAAAVVTSSATSVSRPQVRVNPLYLQQQQQQLVHDPASEDVVIDVGGGSKILCDASMRAAPPTFSSSTTPKCSTTSHTSKARLRVRF